MRQFLPLTLPWGNYSVVLGGRQRQWYLFRKRLLDLTLCLALLPLALPLMAVIALVIRLESPGPALFIQERLGLGGRRFRLLKFRTMRQAPEGEGEREFMKAFVAGQVGRGESQAARGYKPNHAARLTRLGRFLRRTSLDELPQLVNVLRGEMSLVGPRPNVAWEFEVYQEWHKERLEVWPGITGLAQVRGRSNLPFNKIVQYDIAYVRSQSLKLDLQILWWTAQWVLSGRGAG